MDGDNICLDCGGTGILISGEPCPKCAKLLQSKAVRTYQGATVPMQYQGVEFDKSFLPMNMQKGYGDYMEDLLTTIATDYQMYQKNLLICSRPNSGKTVWAYNLIMILADNGYDIPTVLDLVSVREHLNYRSQDTDLQHQVVYSRGLIIRVPADIQFWMFGIMQSVIERRVAHNGFTIFLYSGNYSNLKDADKNHVLDTLIGTGSFHSIRLEDFTK